jgi:hypothetical protein
VRQNWFDRGFRSYYPYGAATACVAHVCRAERLIEFLDFFGWKESQF